jgi:cytochrome c oxidase subunit 4
MGKSSNVLPSQHSHDQNSHHIIPLRTYLNVFAALIVLTVVTVVASRLEFGAFNAIIAFGIASVKAVLVLAYFMHLKYDNMMNRVIIASGVFFLLVLYMFVLVDDITRIFQGSTL